MSLEHDSEVAVQHYPIPMRRFGLNPFGEPRYRIVLTQSVMHLVGGEWPDGTRAYRSVPRYREVRAGWILEAWDWARMPKAEWESLREPISGWPVLGPYPSRGEYQLAWEFDKGVEVDNLDAIIGAIERGRNRSFQDVRDYAMREYQQEEKDWKQAAAAEVRDAVTAFGVAPMVAYGGHRGTKTAPELRSAQELGLPVPRRGPRASRTIGQRRTFDMRDAQVTSSLIAGRT